MKLLSLNTHSLIEDNYPRKLSDFAHAIVKESPDIIALQEVNQTIAAPIASDLPKNGMVLDRQVRIREDNHVLNAARMLSAQGLDYHFVWLPIKKGYDRFDEGLALMSLSPILAVDCTTVSRSDDYASFKTRKLLGIRCESAPEEWFYSVHYGWWNDSDDPFDEQWERTIAHMRDRGTVWLMGDFNNPAEVRGEGYDRIVGSGWIDSYTAAEKKDRGITVDRSIDGWSHNVNGLRIDQIWCSRKVRVRSSRVVFNGEESPVISDHYGVIAEYKRSHNP